MYQVRSELPADRKKRRKANREDLPMSKTMKGNSALVAGVRADDKTFNAIFDKAMERQQKAAPHTRYAHWRRGGPGGIMSMHNKIAKGARQAEQRAEMNVLQNVMRKVQGK